MVGLSGHEEERVAVERRKDLLEVLQAGIDGLDGLTIEELVTKIVGEPYADVLGVVTDDVGRVVAPRHRQRR